MSKHVEPKDVDDEKTDETQPSDTERTVSELELEAEKLQAKRLDSRTNQPVSDFRPVVEDPEVARRLELTREARKSGSMDAQFDDRREQERFADEQAKRRADIEDRRANAAKEEPREGMSYVPPDVYRAREQAKVAQAAADITSSTTVPGGKFIVNGELVNSYGDLIDENGVILVKRHRPISG